MPDFSKLLQKPVTSAERPKPKAPGTYHGVVSKYEYGESQQKKTPYVRFHLGSIAPGPEVDVEENARNGIDLSKWAPVKDFFLTDDALYRLREFLESCKIPVEGRSFNETIPEAIGQAIQFEVVNTTSSKPGQEAQIYSNVGDISGA
jgi:hypothetical protein